MVTCEMCRRWIEEEAYALNLGITSVSGSEDEPFQRYNTICSNCKNRIVALFPANDEYYG